MRKQIWWIVVAFVVGWILAPLADPPVASKPDEVLAISTVADHSAIALQLVSR